MKRLRIGYANVEQVKNPKLKRFFDFDSDLILTTESNNARKAYRRKAKRKSYRLHQFRAGWEARSVAALTKGPSRKSRMRMRRTWWWGTRGSLRHRAPRTYLKLRLGKGDDRWFVLGVHFPPGGPNGAVFRTGGRNRKAWRESRRRVVKKARRWQKKHPGLPIVLIGDFNCTRMELKDQIADPLGAKVVTFGKVDHAVLLNCRHAEGHKFSGVGHGWVAIRLEHL